MKREGGMIGRGSSYGREGGEISVKVVPLGLRFFRLFRFRYALQILDELFGTLPVSMISTCELIVCFVASNERAGIIWRVL